MNYTALYDALAARSLVYHDQLKPGDRIALLHRGGIEELDVMKIRSIGHSAAAPNDGLIAVAYLCPGQLSFRVKRDGKAYLNRLADPMRTQQYAVPSMARSSFFADAWVNPRKTRVDLVEDVLLNGPGKKYWVPLAGGSRIVKLKRNEMRVLQELVLDPPA